MSFECVRRKISLLHQTSRLVCYFLKKAGYIKSSKSLNGPNPSILKDWGQLMEERLWRNLH